MEILDYGSLAREVRDPDQLAREGYAFRIGEYLNFAFRVLQKDPLSFFAFAIVSSIIASVPFLAYPAYAGFYAVADKISKNEPYTFDDFFTGFRERIGPLILASIVVQVLVFAGMLLCVLPGLYLAIAWLFSIPFILFRAGDFWQSMEWSRKVISHNWFGFFALGLIAGILSSLGIILCVIGLFLTLPIFHLAIYAAYKDIVGTGGKS